MERKRSRLTVARRSAEFLGAAFRLLAFALRLWLYYADRF